MRQYFRSLDGILAGSRSGKKRNTVDVSFQLSKSQRLIVDNQTFHDSGGMISKHDTRMHLP